MFTQPQALSPLLRWKRFAIYGLIGGLILLLQVQAAAAQGQVIILQPQVEGTVGENGWYVSDVFVSWPVPSDAFDIVGCQDTLIDYDSAGVTLICEFSVPNAHGAAELEIKRDANPPDPTLNVPTDEPLLMPEGSMQPLLPTYDPWVEVSPVQFFVDTDEDALFDDEPLFEAIDGLAEAVTTPKTIAWRFVDEAGNETLLITEVIVGNVPPSMVLDEMNVHLGNAASLFLSFSDPGVLDTHSAVIDWGDGLVTPGMVLESLGSGTISGAHVYDKPGEYTAVITVTDKDGVTDTTVVDVSAGRSQQALAALGATFEDPASEWNTHINGIFPLVLTAEDSQPQAVLSPEQGGCLGMLSWTPADGQADDDVPALAFCLANATVSEQEFNLWQDGGGGHIIPNLAIPLSPLANEQLESQSWTNPQPVTARLFTLGCGESHFRRYADLLLASGDLVLNTGTNDLGRPEIEISAELVQQEPDPGTWDSYLTGCETADLLPETALAGTALDFGGGTFYNSPDPATSFGQFVLLEDQVSAFAFDGRLDIAEALKLDHVLDKVMERWRDVTGDQALHGMYKFVDDVNKLVDSGDLQTVDGDTLTDQALSLADLINSPTSPPSPIPHPSGTCGGVAGPCEDTLPACTAGDGLIELYVDAAAAAVGADGSWKKPFTTITEALELAANQSACGVRVHVANGTYNENLNISRHTFIVGEKYVFIQGGITLFGPHALHLDSLRLRSQTDSIGAAIFAAHPCARLVLQSVHIAGYPGYGIRQSGGSLDIGHSRVTGTTALQEHLSQGSGIYLTCGVQAHLVDVWLDHNESSGLRIAGEGTEVEAERLTVSHTGIHPILAQYLAEECDMICDYPLPETGAISVSEGAILEVSRLLVEDNLNAGVQAESGGEVLLEHATVRRTERVVDNWNSSANVIARIGGHIRLHNFVIENSHIGLHIGFGEIDAHSGLVTGNYIGVLVPPGGYDLRRISNHVRWVDNRINIGGTTDPVFSCPPPEPLCE